jgi:predicted nucleic acid-binding protein
MIRVDTGYFIFLHQRHPRAMALWQNAANGQVELVLSTLTITEAQVYFLHRGLTQDASEWLELIANTNGIHVVPVSDGIAARSARYRLGLRLPTVDAVILTTFLAHNCTLMLTTDSHFQIVQQQNLIPVELLT